jgi:hypothetical protein
MITRASTAVVTTHINNKKKGCVFQVKRWRVNVGRSQCYVTPYPYPPGGIRISLSPRGIRIRSNIGGTGRPFPSKGNKLLGGPNVCRQ